MSDEKDSKYLDPDLFPLESDDGPPPGADADKSPLDGPDPLPGMDPDRDPFDGSSVLADLYRSAFGGVENVRIDDVELRRSGEKVEVYDGGTWRSAESLSLERRGEIAERIRRFREKQSE